MLYFMDSVLFPTHARTHTMKQVGNKKSIPVLIYLLTASGLPPGGSCTVHIYTQTIHRTTQNKQYIEQKIWAQHKIWEQYKKFGRVRAVPVWIEVKWVKE
jgi:hypothetical protein